MRWTWYVTAHSPAHAILPVSQDLPSATGAGKGASVKSTAAQGEVSCGQGCMRSLGLTNPQPPRPVRRVPGTGPRSVRAPNEPSPTVAAVGTAPAPTGVNVSTPSAVASGASANVPPGTDQAALDDVSSIKVRCGAARMRHALTTNVACKEVEGEQEEQEEGG